MNILKSLILILLFIPNSFAQVDDATAIRIIVGAAAAEGFSNMVAVGNCLINRGSTKGYEDVLAYKHTDKERQYTWDQAKLAWDVAKRYDITHGATEWKNPDRKVQLDTQTLKQTVAMPSKEAEIIYYKIDQTKAENVSDTTISP